MSKRIKKKDSNETSCRYVKVTIELTDKLGHLPTAQEVYNYLIKRKQVIPYQPIVRRKINE